MKRVLIVEDDKAILRGLVDSFKAEHFEVETSTDGELGYSIAKKNKCDILILDVMLPRMNGFDICRQLRSDGVKTPILMLTGKGEEIDKVMGLELGADDYLTKPFSIKELLARVKALLRRQADIHTEMTEATFGDVYVDFKKQEAVKGKRKLDLTAKEFQLLKYFVEREGDVISRNQLLDDVWGYQAMPTTRTVDNYILSLRKKIESSSAKPKHLLTIHTAGYKFVR
ncbi:MAG: response regulator transcription factor [Ignavibacteriales bacterium]|nr:response regulator transcription factor [Ignavibacteriales bacterium]